MIDSIMSNELERVCCTNPLELGLLSKVVEENEEVFKQLAWLEAKAKYATREK